MRCAAELSELVLGRPAGHSASPRDTSSDPLVHVYPTIAPMNVMGSSFQTTPTSNMSARVPPTDRKPAIVSRGTSGSFSSGSCLSGSLFHLASSVSTPAAGVVIGESLAFGPDAVAVSAMP
jgi:hypothetical protein